jgi:hypothetical protein
MVQREIVSAVFWIHVKLSSQISEEKQLRIRVEGSSLSRKSIKFHLKSLKHEWNKIKITKIFDLTALNSHDFNENKTLNFKVEIKCFDNCLIGYSDNNVETNYVLNEEKIFDMVVDTSISRKPMLSINILENKNGDLNDNSQPPSTSHIRNKRRAYQNHRSSNIDPENYSPKLCYNNYPDSDRECCLITYFVNFNSLKWSSWILSPNGFVANYCSGKCNELKSI